MKIIKVLLFFTNTVIFIYIIYNLLLLILNSYINKKNILKYTNNKFQKLKINKFKINRFKYISKLNFYIYELKKINEKKYNFISIFSIIFISIIFSVIMYFISKKIFCINSTAFFISIFSFFIPYFLIQKIYENKKQKILYNFPMYLLNLKNYVYSTNDILLAFKKASIPTYIKLYINKFNISIEKGMGVVQAFENLKKDINIEIISNFLNSIVTCHLNGGNVCTLLNKYSEILTKINAKKAKQEQENLSNLIIFIILIIINIFLVFTFVYSNTTYKEIITTTFVGKIIINVNVLSYMLIYLLYKKINKRN